ncbi:MAG TPA: hypothetical protein VIX80_08490 [Candidatus Kapabacteria bacterium]
MIEVVFILITLGICIFIVFFAEDVLNNFLKTNLNESVRTASGGRYSLKLGHIYYQRGTIFCKTFYLAREKYDSTETGVTVQSIHADTVWFGDIKWIDLLTGKGLFMTKMEMRRPTLTMTSIGAARTTIEEDISRNDVSGSMPKQLPVVSFDSIVLHDIQVNVPRSDSLGDSISITGTNARLRNFSLTDTSLVYRPLLFSEDVSFSINEGRHIFGDSVYSITAKNITGSLTDSVVAVDTISFLPNYSETAFAAREKYNRGRMELQCTDVQVVGLDALPLLAGRSISYRKFEAANWNADYYSDKRKPQNPRPDAAMMPNDLIESFSCSFNIDSIILRNGNVRIRERVSGSSAPGVIGIQKVFVKAYPICTDTLLPKCSMPTRITVSGLFMGEGRVNAVVTYPLHNKTLDFDLEASIGPCSIKLLNPFLIPNERKEVTAGNIINGSLTMKVRNGVATTSVTPVYKDFSMKILSTSVHEERGIIEGIKTFVANSFILRSTNLAQDGRRIVSATTRTVHKKDQELLTFIWVATRKSLGSVIGGFE